MNSTEGAEDLNEMPNYIARHEDRRGAHRQSVGERPESRRRQAPRSDHTLIALHCRGHALIEGLPGTDKTTLAKTMAVSLGYGFKRM